MQRSALAYGLMALMLVGCGNHRAPAPAGATAAPSTSAATPAAPTPTPAPTLAGAHGELVAVPAGSGTTLAFRVDGEAEARGVPAPAPRTGAGARLGSTLTVDGRIEPNAGGATGLAERLQVDAFAVDEVAVCGRLGVAALAGGGLVFEANDGRRFEPTGPLAAALLAEPVDVPLFVTGDVDAAHVPAARGALGLSVTAFRDAVEVGLSSRGGLLAYDSRLLVEDAAASGRYRLKVSALPWANLDRTGAGILPAADQTDLEQLVAAADLRSQPVAFQGLPVWDVPQTFLTYADRTGQVTIEIGFQAQLPTEVAALVTRLKDLQEAVPTLRTLDRGAYSTITRGKVEVTRTAAGLKRLMGEIHGSAPAAAPKVDLKEEVVVAAFRGLANVSDRIEVASIERLGDDIYVTIDRAGSTLRPALPLRAPAIKLPLIGKTITAPALNPAALRTRPYDLAAIDFAGLKGNLIIDGQTYPLRKPRLVRPNLPITTLPPVLKPTLPVPQPIPPIPQPQPVPPIIKTPQPIGPAPPKPIGPVVKPKLTANLGALTQPALMLR